MMAIACENERLARENGVVIHHIIQNGARPQRAEREKARTYILAFEFMVEVRGLEPLASGLQSPRSPI